MTARTFMHFQDYVSVQELVSIEFPRLTKVFYVPCTFGIGIFLTFQNMNVNHRRKNPRVALLSCHEEAYGDQTYILLALNTMKSKVSCFLEGLIIRHPRIPNPTLSWCTNKCLIKSLLLVKRDYSTLSQLSCSLRLLAE